MAHSIAAPSISSVGAYKGFHLIQCSGHIYGIPALACTDTPKTRQQLSRYPITLSAPTREELQALVEECDLSPCRSETLEEFEGYELVRYGGRTYGLPRSLGPLDLDVEQERSRHEVLSGESAEQVREQIRTARQAASVEFGGALPVFDNRFGIYGFHPQFAPTRLAPAGYKFVRPARSRLQASQSRPAGRWHPGSWILRLLQVFHAVFQAFAAFVTNCVIFGPRAYLRTLVPVLRLAFIFLKRGVGPVPILRFLRSRHLRSQLMLSGRAELVFFTSVPYTFSQQPWVVEIEDVTTLFCPFLRNGQTSDIDVAASPYFQMVKALLESENCKGIITHMRSTARALPVLFQSAPLTRKTSYLPLGIELPEHHASQEDDVHLNLLFTNSWHQDPDSFYLRGGLDVLEAFAILQDRYPHLRLTLRTALPQRMHERYFRIIEHCQVRVISRFLPSEDLHAMLRQSHVYLLPAARVHVVSLLQAMAHGLAVVTSDGWGFDEYLTHDGNGLVVEGRYGKVSWLDEETGMLRENYDSMYTPDPRVVQGLVDALTRLIEDRHLRLRLGRQARSDVQTKHSLEQWNKGLQAVFDRIRSV